MNFFRTAARLAIGILAFAASQILADVVVDTVSVGSSPVAMGIDTGLNKIYVVNRLSNNVTVIDGATDTTITVAVGTTPEAIAINPITHKVYVSNNSSNNVTVIDGRTNSTSNVIVGQSPRSLAVNSITNRIYVVNTGGNSVTVINGANNATATIVMQTPYLSNGIAVNPVTNLVYVGGCEVAGGRTGYCYIMVVNGTNNDTTAKIWLNVAYPPNEIVVNTVTNKIYAAGSNPANTGGAIFVIDGSNNTAISKQNSRSVNFVDVNEVTNKVYATTGEGVLRDGEVIGLNGLTNDTTQLSASVSGVHPSSLGINPITNMIFVTMTNGSGVSGNLTTIDCSTKLKSSVLVGVNPTIMAVNPVTHKIYVGNVDRSQINHNVMVIDGASSPTLGAPLLLSPFNTAPGQPVSLLLSWKKVEYASKYMAQVSLDSNFNSTVINQSNIDSTSTVVSGLDAGGWNYFWRVRGVSSTGNPGPWSNIWKFTTTTNHVRFSQVQLNAGAIALNGRIAIYALNGKCLCQKTFPMRSTRSEIFNNIPKRLSTGIYQYQLFSGQKIVEKRTFLIK